MLVERRLRIGVTVCATMLAAAHVLRPALNIDSITVALLIAAAIPWLQPIFKSVELPGGFKVELQELKREVKEAIGAASSAENKADYAMSAATATTGPDATATSQTANHSESLALLVAEYNHIRKTQPSGSARTQAMTSVVRRLIELSPLVSDFDLETNLLSDDAGWRLAAYAYSYAKPDAKSIEVLVRSVTRKEDKPFGQYWGLQAIERVLVVCKSADIPAAALADLQSYGETVPRGTDRDHELRKMLRDLGRTIPVGG